MSRTMSGISTSSSGGDAFLAGGLTEAAPQEFTGFNNFTKDTHFDEDIDADDTIRLNGSSAAANIAAISMVGGDNGGVIGGNTIGQNEAGTYGNSIYQISDPNKPLVLPAANGCIIHQTGNTDIIRTEGKVQMALAPAVGEDLCNKTYVDAAGGGGSLVGCAYYLTNSSGAVSNLNIGHKYQVQVYDTNSIYDLATGIFTIPAGQGGKWLFYAKLFINGSGSNNFTNYQLFNTATLPVGSSSIFSVGRSFQYYSVNSASFNPIDIYLPVIVDCAAGENFYWYNGRAVGSFNVTTSNGRGRDTYMGAYKLG